MQAVAGQPFVATLPAPPDIAGLGARVEIPVTRAIVSFWRPATLTNAVWSVTLDPVVDVGDYELVWRTNDGDPPEFETFVPLTVTAAVAGAPDTPVDPSAWTPSVQDVADVSVSLTRSTIDEGGQEVGVFDDTTEPTGTQVQEFIAAAVREVSGRVGVAIPARCVALARSTATWHAAATVEADRDPAGADETEGARGWKWSSYVACLNELITQARSGALRLV